MLISLSIQNYALIDQLSIDFKDKLSIITGETGAGKSILLGALGLVLGNRAELSSLNDPTKKCVIEVQLAIDKYNLQDFFNTIDIDYQSQTIIRREILPSGKSRAFVNDTPVTLSVLSQLKSKLIDIHSQHQTTQLSDVHFQFNIIDVLAKNQQKIASYKRGLEQYNQLKKELLQLQENQQELNNQYDYNTHLCNELKQANLQDGEQEIAEQKLEKLNHIEDIKLNLSEALQISVSDDIGMQSLLYSLENNLQKIASFSKEYQILSNRISSVKIELEDIILQLETMYELVDFNPNQIEELNDRLQVIYNLQKKHKVNSIKQLLIIYEKLSEKLSQVENTQENIQKKEQEIHTVRKKLDQVAHMISEARIKAIPKLKKQLEFLASELGMPNAQFSIEILPSKTYFFNGKDQLNFLFSANKGGNFGALKKVASGGELSRIMLSIKKILSENIELPTIIFDEIDTGVSGEISNKIATIMQQMSKYMQVIVITHLPQIAAKGNQHYKVYKQEINQNTVSNLKLLSKQERIEEIAQMLAGKSMSNSAIIHAKQLLN